MLLPFDMDDFTTLKSVMNVNEKQKQSIVLKLKNYFDGNLSGKKIALWGLAFKPDTDDIREAPALSIIDRLLEAGAAIVAHDPEAMANVERLYDGRSTQLTFADDPLKALESADALVVATEWKVFQSVDIQTLRALLRQSVIFDGRNIFDPQIMRSHDFTYYSIGRP